MTTGMVAYDVSETGVAELAELIQINRESARGFRETAKVIPQNGVSSLFHEIASEREVQGIELARHLETESGAGDDLPRQPFLPLTRQRWEEVQEACARHDLEAVIHEAMRGEIALQRAYAAARRAAGGQLLQPILDEHYRWVQARQDQLREARNKQRSTHRS